MTWTDSQLHRKFRAVSPALLLHQLSKADTALIIWATYLEDRGPEFNEHVRIMSRFRKVMGKPPSSMCPTSKHSSI